MNFLFQKRRVIVLLFILLCFSFSLSAQEKDVSPFWETSFMLVTKLSVNPSILSKGDVDSIIGGLNVGVDIVPTVGPLAFSIGYQFMGIAGMYTSLADNAENLYERYYSGVRGDALNVLHVQEHMFVFVPMFAWHRGIVRPYIGTGLALNLHVPHTIIFNGKRYGDAIGISLGLISQFGIDFFPVKWFGLGFGVDFIIRDMDTFIRKHDERSRLLTQAPAVVSRLVFKF